MAHIDMERERGRIEDDGLSVAWPWGDTSLDSAGRKCVVDVSFSAA